MSWLCAIGLHDKAYGSTRFVLMGVPGLVEAWWCRRCGYRCPDGEFISDETLNRP